MENRIHIYSILTWRNRARPIRWFMNSADLQEWNWGSWGWRGWMRTEDVDVVSALTWDGIEGLASFRPQIDCLLNSSSKRMGCIQFTYLFSSFRFCGKHSFFEYPSLSRVPCRCMSARGDWIIELSKRKVMKFHEISVKLEFCKSQLIRQGHLISFQQRCNQKKLDTK